MAALESAQAAAEREMVRGRARDEAPEAFGVVEFGEMAELVDDDVVGDIGRQKYQFVIEIKVPFFRTTPPPRFVILDKDLADPKSVVGIEMRDARPHECACVFAQAQVLLSVASPQ